MTSVPATAIDPRWICGLLQAGDSFYPTGGYAHSFGLEGLIHEGVVHDRTSLREFLLRGALPALQQAELPLASHAWGAFAGPDWEEIRRLCLLSSAMKSAREARSAAEAIGRQRAELCATLHRSPLAQEFVARARVDDWPHSPALAAALEGRALNAPCEAVLAGLYYSTIAALLSAAMKLLRLGQNGAQGMLSELLTAAPAAIAAARETPREEIGWFNPWLDIAAARHEAAGSRMFIS